jgi:hypothetical protein
MFTWIPRDDFRQMMPQMHLKDLQSSTLAVDAIIHSPDTALPELVRLWSGYRRELARYGLNLLKEIEARAHLNQPMKALGVLLAEMMLGATEFETPKWWTPELCANHRGVLKYLDIRRTLKTRIKKHIGAADEWLNSHGYGSVTKMSAAEVKRAHEALDSEKAVELRPFYSHWDEEPIGTLIWPKGERDDDSQ